MNLFVWPLCLCGCNGGFQIHDSQIDGQVLEFLKRVAPDVIKAHRPLDRAVRCLGKIDICARVANVRFVQNRIHRMRQRLINAAPGHHIAAEKET